MSRKQEVSMIASIANRLKIGLVAMLIVTFAGFTIASAAQAGGAKTSPKVSMSTPVKLAYLDMVSPSAGWGISGHLLLSTSDGGHIWTRQVHLSGSTGSNAYSFGLAAVNENDAWVAQERGISGAITIWFTNNGGSMGPRTHMQLPGRIRGGSIQSLQFVNAKVGWLMVTGSGAAGSIGHELLRTTNGGATWRRIEYNYIGQQSPHAIGACDFVANVTFAGTRDGWSTGICGAATGIHSVYRTTDGGRTWFVKNLPLQSCHCQQAFFESLPPTFAGHTGVLPAGIYPPSRFVLYRTLDAGKNWIKTTPIKGLSRAMGPRVVEVAFDPSHVWVLLNQTLYSTTDAGRHWTAVSHHPGLGLSTKLQFVSNVDGFALRGGHPEFIKATADGGHTWHKVRTLL
jgi:photosystem II stability/assembly factor-like uncharacterized protein